MKKLLFIALVALMVLMLSGCVQEQVPVANPNPSGTQAQTQESPIDAALNPSADLSVPDGYDPSGEEDYELNLDENATSSDSAPLYPGASPIPLDPVNMPSPTKRPDLTFTFATYTASKLGITFESVAGYTVDDSQADVYVLTEPIEQQKENYSVVFTFSRTAVTNAYSLSNLRSDLRAFAAELGKVNYQEWRVSSTADRTLLGKPGAYVTYRGVMHDGTIVRGRIHMALLDNNRVLTIHYTGPGEYNTDYSNTVFTRIRSTLKAL